MKRSRAEHASASSSMVRAEPRAWSRAIDTTAAGVIGRHLTDPVHDLESQLGDVDVTIRVGIAPGGRGHHFGHRDGLPEPDVNVSVAPP